MEYQLCPHILKLKLLAVQLQQGSFEEIISYTAHFYGIYIENQLKLTLNFFTFNSILLSTSTLVSKFGPSCSTITRSSSYWTTHRFSRHTWLQEQGNFQQLGNKCCPNSQKSSINTGLLEATFPLLWRLILGSHYDYIPSHSVRPHGKFPFLLFLDIQNKPSIDFFEQREASLPSTTSNSIYYI